jgi:hypothetical protein
MVTEIKDLNDAEARVEELFKGTLVTRLQKDDEIKDYAKIALFLTDPNAVTSALEEVSKQIWIRYNLPDLKQSPNRFSRAIIRYGADVFGFAVQDNIVFTGPLKGGEFSNYVRSGVLWKDTFAPSHGEFSHSLQWFAAGVSLRLGERIAALYKKAGSIFSNSDQMATRGDDGNLARGRQPLWAWLVDCFQPGNLDGQILPGDNNHVFSKRFRVPNQINSIVLNKPEWFINLYIDHRKTWLNKVAARGKVMRRTDGETDEPESNLLGIMKYQKAAYGTKTDQWKLDDTPSTSKKEIERSGAVFKKTLVTNTTKAQIEKPFHGVEGTISLLAVDSKSLIV